MTPSICNLLSYTPVNQTGVMVTVEEAYIHAVIDEYSEIYRSLADVTALLHLYAVTLNMSVPTTSVCAVLRHANRLLDKSKPMPFKENL